MKKLSLIILIFLSSGCVGFFTVPSKEALKQPLPPLKTSIRTTLYRPSLSGKALNEGGMAILGILKGGPAGLRQNAAFELFQALRTQFPNGRIVPRSDLVRRARTTGRLPGLRADLKRYGERHVLDSEWLREWARIEGVRYFFIARVTKNDKHTFTRTMQLGEKGVAGKVDVFSSGPVHIPYEVKKVVALAGEVWDVSCGKLVWMGASRAEITEVSKRERVRVEDISTAVTRNLILELQEAMGLRGKIGTVAFGPDVAC